MDRHIFFKKCKTKQFTDNEIFSQNLQEKQDPNIWFTFVKYDLKLFDIQTLG